MLYKFCSTTNFLSQQYFVLIFNIMICVSLKSNLAERHSYRDKGERQGERYLQLVSSLPKWLQRPGSGA